MHHQEVKKMSDFLLKTFFEKQRWINAIETGIDKEIDIGLLRDMSSPQTRLNIYNQIKNGTYVIKPPHEAQIPKDDGSMRTVYVNESIDRILLSIYNDMIFELCPEMIHPNCVSYQKGIGCGKIVQAASKQICNITNDIIGVKIDLSKYFDSVPIKYIDDIFAKIDKKFGESAITNIVKKYYHDDTVIDMDKNLITKYSSLRQGCAFAAFLADAVLFDIDDELSKQNVMYVRYSDDILVVGENWENAYKILKQKLQEKQLTLNPKKVETLYKHKWFKFLGFTIQNDKISISKNRIKTFQREIEKRTIKQKTNQIDDILKSVNHYLYKGDGTYSWATSVLPIINVEKDITTLNTFVMDAIRAACTGKTKIGGLGIETTLTTQTIIRGKGKNVRTNREKIKNIPNYRTIRCMRNAMLASKEAYRTLTAAM